jgi:hypothetical protein
MVGKANIGQPSIFKNESATKKALTESENKYNTLLTETKELKSKNDEYKHALKNFRTMLAETVVFNSNLTYVTKLFMEHCPTPGYAIDVGANDGIFFEPAAPPTTTPRKTPATPKKKSLVYTIPQATPPPAAPAKRGRPKVKTEDDFKDARERKAEERIGAKKKSIIDNKRDLTKMNIANTK